MGTSNSNEEFCLMGYNAVQSVKVSCFGKTFCLQLQDRRISQARNQHESSLLGVVFAAFCHANSCSAYFSALKMEMTCFLKHRLAFNRLDGVILHNHRCANLLSYKVIIMLLLCCYTTQPENFDYHTVGMKILITLHKFKTAFCF
jgi:hypothetical protein